MLARDIRKASTQIVTLVMEEELRGLVQEGSYEALLLKTSELLLENPQNSLALTYKGWALASLSRYEEASEILLQAMKVNACPIRLSSLQELEGYCRRICAATQDYDLYSRQTASVPSTWYSDRLFYASIGKEVSFGNRGYAEMDERLKKLGEDSSCVFVCGYKRKIAEFRGLDWNVRMRLRSDLPPYPLTQSTYEGYIYMKTQTFNLNWRQFFEGYRYG